MIPIVPAIIPQSQSDLQSRLAQLSFSNEIHIDVVDGQFTASRSWPYDPVDSVQHIQTYIKKHSLEIDLMATDPLAAADEWVAAGADMLVFHLETVSLENFRNFANSSCVTVGISAHGDTTMEALREYAQYADYVQVMGIYEIGSMQQPFDESVFDKIKVIKKTFPNKVISVDGSVNADTIGLLREAGANRFVVGSAITLQENSQQAHGFLSSLIN